MITYITIVPSFFFSDWSQKYPKCGAPNQSPINLLSDDLRDLTRKIRLVNYEQPLGLIVENTGHGRKF